MNYCKCETPIMDVEHDAGCRRCGLPVDFSPQWRVDVQGVGETIWVSNALRFDTEAEAESYARGLYARWMGMQAWRVVPDSTPEREQVAS